MVNHMKKDISAIVILMLLMLTLLSSAFVAQSHSTMPNASQSAQDIDTNAEYSNGTIGSPLQGLSLWYDWVNTSNTQVLFLAYQSYVLNPPVVTFLGQHYYTENNTEVFVGNTLTAMEVYNDTNGNGVPDGNWTSEPIFYSGEIVYYFYVNSSASFVITPIEKSLINNVPHYTWGFRYNTIDGFLISPLYALLGAKVKLDFLAFSYDFYVQGNVTYLKTSFDIGKPLEIIPFGSANVTLNGLSLSLLYETTVIAAKPYQTLVNGSPYNSTTTAVSAVPTESSEIKVADVKAYEFLFGQNYTLYRDSQQETYESKTAAVANRTVPTSMRVSVEWLLSNLEDVLSGLFPRISNLQAAINLDYSVSSFLYRVCYPKWDGYRIKHDPTYLAYMNASAAVPEIQPPLAIVVTAALLGFIALTVALTELKKTRKMLRYTPQNPTAASASF